METNTPPQYDAPQRNTSLFSLALPTTDQMDYTLEKTVFVLCLLERAFTISAVGGILYCLFLLYNKGIL